MWWSILIDGGTAVALLAIWYFFWRLWMRRRSRHILQWVEVACRRHGQVDQIQWISASRFQVNLRLKTSAFRHANLVVQLTPREMPFSWLWYRLHKCQETATFAASLDCPPAFNLDVQNHHWCGTYDSEATVQSTGWKAERLGTMVISTRSDWQHDVVNMMGALADSRSFEFLKIEFRKQEPHFSATIALNAMEPDAMAEMNVFDVIRELATSSSASAF